MSPSAGFERDVRGEKQGRLRKGQQRRSRKLSSRQGRRSSFYASFLPELWKGRLYRAREVVSHARAAVGLLVYTTTSGTESFETPRASFLHDPILARSLFCATAWVPVPVKRVFFFVGCSSMISFGAPWLLLLPKAPVAWIAIQYERHGERQSKLAWCAFPEGSPSLAVRRLFLPGLCLFPSQIPSHGLSFNLAPKEAPGDAVGVWVGEMPFFGRFFFFTCFFNRSYASLVLSSSCFLRLDRRQLQTSQEALRRATGTSKVCCCGRFLSSGCLIQLSLRRPLPSPSHRFQRSFNHLSSRAPPEALRGAIGTYRV